MKELKEFDYFKAWLLFFLIATVGGGILGMIVGAFVAAFLGAGGMPLAQMTRILRIMGFVIIGFFKKALEISGAKKVDVPVKLGERDGN